MSESKRVRFARLITVIRVPRFAGRHRGVVDQLQQVLAVAGDNGQLLTVLAECVELKVESGLDLLTGDVGKLSFGDERLGFSANEFLLKYNNARRTWLLVLQVGDLIRNFLLSCFPSGSTRRGRGWVTHYRGLAGQTPQCSGCF